MNNDKSAKQRFLLLSEIRSILDSGPRRGKKKERRGFSTRGSMRGGKVKDKKDPFGGGGIPDEKVFSYRATFRSTLLFVSFLVHIYSIYKVREREREIRNGSALARQLVSRTCTAVRQLDAMGSRRI